MGDDGLAVGAALYKCFQLYQKAQTRFESDEIDDVYWGPEYSNKGIERALDEFEFPYEFHERIESKVAGLLADGKIVARFAGRMEYGPRALGNRSILYTDQGYDGK